MKHTNKIKAALLALLIAPGGLFAYWDNAHMNMSEDALLYMEQSGSNQMRWAAHYLHAKAGGRYSGDCYTTYHDDGNPVATECGMNGIARQGAIAPDYLHDTWWVDTSTWGWGQEIAGTIHNFTSWSHFMNMQSVNDLGNTVVNNNYNDNDGYSYNGSFGFEQVGIDYSIASFMNDAWMTIDLNNCWECGGKKTLAPGGNPATDYKQNGSTTPVGSATSDGYKSGHQDGTNYNCFSDTSTNACPDVGSQVGGTYQVPNTQPGAGGGWSDWSGDEDWVIYEPADNAATFYYNEWFLEGGTSNSGSAVNSLQTGAVAGRYYTVDGVNDLIYMTAVMHYAGDMVQPNHVWIVTGYNHSGYEEWVEYRYGARVPGQNSANNYEDHSAITAYVNGRQKSYQNGLDDIITEEATQTHRIRLRSGHDTMVNTDDTTRTNTATWAVNNGIATMALLYEKGVIDLRNYR